MNYEKIQKKKNDKDKNENRKRKEEYSIIEGLTGRLLELWKNRRNGRLWTRNGLEKKENTQKNQLYTEKGLTNWCLNGQGQWNWEKKQGNTQK